jgi:hypothetical protein
VYSCHGGSRQIERIGSAHDDAELELRQAVARQRLAAGQACWIWARVSAVPGGPLPITSSGAFHRATPPAPGQQARGR